MNRITRHLRAFVALVAVLERPRQATLKSLWVAGYFRLIAGFCIGLAGCLSARAQVESFGIDPEAFVQTYRIVDENPVYFTDFLFTTPLSVTHFENTYFAAGGGVYAVADLRDGIIKFHASAAAPPVQSGQVIVGQCSARSEMMIWDTITIAGPFGADPVPIIIRARAQGRMWGPIAASPNHYDSQFSFSLSAGGGVSGDDEKVSPVRVVSELQGPEQIDEELVLVRSVDSTERSLRIQMRTFGYTLDGGSVDLSEGSAISVELPPGFGFSSASGAFLNQPLPNSIPIAEGQTLSTLEATPVVVTLTGTDDDGDTLAFAVTSEPSHGTLSGSAPSLIYTPNPDFADADSFTFKVNDGKVDSAAATVTITVTPVNESPGATPDYFTAVNNTVLILFEEDLLWNDADSDNDALAISSVSPAQNGMVTLNADRSINYTPAQDFFGADTFTYDVIDGQGGSATGIVAVQVLPSGSVYVWGENDRGQVGNGTTSLAENAPVGIALPDNREIAMLSGGSRFSVAIATDGTAWAWGAGEEGQLGNGLTVNSSIPVRVGLPIRKLNPNAAPNTSFFTYPLGLAAGGNHALAIHEGAIYSWGLGSAGQLGAGDTSNRSRPGWVPLPGGRGALAVAAGQAFSLALAEDGSVWSWGINIWGQLGDGSSAVIRSSPGEVALPQGRRAVAISAGADHSLVIASDGTMWAWGLNNYGQLGDGTFVNRNSPVQVSGFGNGIIPAMVAGGQLHTLAVDSDGAVWSWGDGSVGKLGRPGFGPGATPARATWLPENSSVRSVAAGQLHSMALLDGGTVLAWGGNYQGQLGIGSPNTSAGPSLVALPSHGRAVAISGGYMHSLAIYKQMVLPDNPPVADAGYDIGIVADNCQGTVTMDGSYSYDPDGDPLSFSWIVRSDDGTPVASIAGGPFPTWTLPAGSYIAELTVSTSKSGQQLSSTDAAIITIGRPRPMLSWLHPNNAPTGSSGFTLRVTGTGFCEGAKVSWNGVECPTMLVSSTELRAQIASSIIVGGTDLVTIPVRVVNMGGLESNPQSFAITPASVSTANTIISAPGYVTSVTTAYESVGVAALVENTSDHPITLTVANYSSNPFNNAFNAGGSFTDLQVGGADSSDSIHAWFYYPSTVVSESETALRLLYFNGSSWEPVRSSGGTDPIKNTSDNLDETLSGGRFTVEFSATSFPAVTQLTGTIFGMFDSTPQIKAVSGPAGPLALGTTATLGIEYASVGDPTLSRVTFVWDDGSQSTVSPSAPGFASATKTFGAAGVYNVRIRVTDEAGGTAEGDFKYVVVYDPNGGFVTGGGWIDSPVGAYRPDPNLTGRANFGFVSRYQKGANLPSGQTEFQLQAADFKFTSSSFDWLVISGQKAQFKGAGAINGIGSYAFLLTVTDGDLGKTGSDRFRIKIWNKSNDQVVYDNAPSSPENIDNANPQAIAGGGIVIHKGK